LFFKCDGKIFMPDRHELREDWRRLRNEELHDFNSSPNITRVIKSRGMTWVRGEEEVRRTYGKPERFIQSFGGET
jgi:hypothetical protein